MTNNSHSPGIAEEIRKSLSQEVGPLRIKDEKLREWLRSLLEEVEHWKQCFIDANRDWARVGNELLDERNKTDELTAQLQQLREELEQVKKERDAIQGFLEKRRRISKQWERNSDRLANEVRSLRSQLADKDKVLELLSSYLPGSDGDIIRSILQQYKEADTSETGR